MTKPLGGYELTKRKLEKALMENSDLRSLNRKLLRRGGFAIDQVLDELTEVLKKTDHSPFQINPVTYSQPTLYSPFDEDHVESAGLAVSDIHLSETVNEDAANGINVYNSMVASNRLYELAQKAKKILTFHRAGYPIERLIVFLLGDIVNGSIHPEFAITNDLTDAAATVLAARLLELLILELKTLGIPLCFRAVVGNHPRMSTKMPTKAIAQTNFDWIVYQMLQMRFENDPQIEFEIVTGPIGITNIYGWRYAYAHGIDVQNGKEESFEDDIRSLFDDPTYRAATGLSGAAFDQIVIGNLHKPKMLERTIVNGSVVGQNELGQAWYLKPIKAQQFLWGISEHNVRTWAYPLDLTKVKDSDARNAFSVYAAEFMRQHGRG